MELNTGQQRLLFAVVVVGLVGLGVFLISGRHQSSASPPAPSPSATPTASGTVASGTASLPPATVPPPAPAPTTSGGTDIYQWLPFTQADLTAAARTTLAFAAVWDTTSYTESGTAYGAKLAGLVTAQERTTLVYDYGTSGVAGPRLADKQVSTGTAAIDSITSFGGSPASITFAVTIDEQITSTKPAVPSDGVYTVTVEQDDGNWLVNDIELSSLGNQ
jgi:hypothetical protein